MYACDGGGDSTFSPQLMKNEGLNSTGTYSFPKYEKWGYLTDHTHYGISIYLTKLCTHFGISIYLTDHCTHCGISFLCI